MTAALGLAIAYLLGGIPFGYLLVKLTTGRDVRASGSQYHEGYRCADDSGWRQYVPRARSARAAQLGQIDDQAGF